MYTSRHDRISFFAAGASVFAPARSHMTSDDEPSWIVPEEQPNEDEDFAPGDDDEDETDESEGEGEEGEQSDSDDEFEAKPPTDSSDTSEITTNNVLKPGAKRARNAPKRLDTKILRSCEAYMSREEAAELENADEEEDPKIESGDEEGEEEYSDEEEGGGRYTDEYTDTDEEEAR